MSLAEYRKDEWIAYGDIGYAFDGVALTYEEYMRTEDCYVAARWLSSRSQGDSPSARGRSGTLVQPFRVN